MAAELLLGAFINTVIDKTVPWCGQYVLDWVRGKGNDDPMKEWTVTLQRIRDVLEDAEEKQLTNRLVRGWLDDLHDLAYDIEDVVDELAIEAQSKTTTEERTSGNKFAEVMMSAASLFKLKPDDEMKTKIEDISRRLEGISEGIMKLGLNSNVVGERVVLSSPQTTSLPPTRVFGREKEKKEIVEMLMKPKADSTEVPVITILGMGGMGKTTLAQDIYHDENVVKCFDMKAWVCVSDVFDVAKITRAILKQILPADILKKLKLNQLELNQLQEKLMEMLSGKKFLLVLDDIWNEKYGEWEVLRRPFPSGAAGSRILATTRNESVASIMSLSRSWYHITKLEDDDCLSLLASHALGRDDFDLHLHLKESGEKIVKKCGYVPLAIKTVAGLLRNKPQMQCEWEAVINSNKWKEESDGILPALHVSYYHLPSHLKRCFAYCSIIPKDYIFDENDLVLLWMAEGFLEQPARVNNRLMEDFGHDCFQELLSRSFFQLTGKSVSEFIMHDLINDLAVHVAGERCFRMDDNREYTISEKTRHLSFIRQDYEVNKKSIIFYTARRSRTFLPLPFHSSSTYFGLFTIKIKTSYLALMLSTLQSLRVLNLEGYHIAKLPNPVDAMKHLRYLNLSNTEIKQLPPFVCSLYNLQTLLLNGCINLRKLPSRIGCLTNLRHLGLEDTPRLKKMSSGIGKLTSLQTLSKIIVGRNKGSCNLKDLKDLRHLHGTLSIVRLRNVTDVEDVVAADLRSKEYLENVTLQWLYFGDSVNSSRDRQLENRVLEKLQPHCNLKLLEIGDYGGIEFPGWVGGQSLPRLRVLKIGHCPKLEKLPKGLHGLACLQEMRIIECPSLVWDAFDRLPESLIKLELINCQKSVLSNWGFHRLTSLQLLFIKGFEEVFSFEQVVGDSNGGGASTSYFFPPSLIELFIHSFPNLESLSNSLQNLTSLREFFIKNCPKLESLSNSLQNLTSLRKLYIYSCPKLESLAGADDDEASLQIISSLHFLDIIGCSQVLNEHCEKEKGKYWPTIQHIPRMLLLPNAFYF